MFIIEKIRGKKVDEETLEKVFSVFFLLLIILIILICGNDIYALIKKTI